MLTKNQAQPPSGGCVLKHNKGLAFDMTPNPAAFGRLCVETSISGASRATGAQPPSGGCVLKRPMQSPVCACMFQPPSGGCVLKQRWLFDLIAVKVPAAFGRLCVETPKEYGLNLIETSSRLRAAVC